MFGLDILYEPFIQHIINKTAYQMYTSILPYFWCFLPIEPSMTAPVRVSRCRHFDFQTKIHLLWNWQWLWRLKVIHETLLFFELSITAKLECETKNIINDYLPVVEDVRNDVVVVELCWLATSCCNSEVLCWFSNCCFFLTNCSADFRSSNVTP